MHGRKMFTLPLVVEAAGKVVVQDGTSTASVSARDERGEGAR